jgi:hypothetical protein
VRVPARHDRAPLAGAAEVAFRDGSCVATTIAVHEVSPLTAAAAGAIVVPEFLLIERPLPQRVPEP